MGRRATGSFPVKTRPSCERQVTSLLPESQLLPGQEMLSGQHDQSKELAEPSSKT